MTDLRIFEENRCGAATPAYRSSRPGGAWHASVVEAYSQIRRKLVAFIKEPALAIWQATKCLAELHA